MSKTASVDEARFTITEAARLLDRSPHTLRSWDRKKSMPVKLRPKRDEHGHRYWTQELIEEIQEWIQENHFHPGNGIAYDPSPEQLQHHIDRIRTSAGERSGHSASARALRSLVDDALDNQGVDPDKLVESLPTVVHQLGGITLAEAMKIASDAIALRS